MFEVESVLFYLRILRKDIIKGRTPNSKWRWYNKWLTLRSERRVILFKTELCAQLANTVQTLYATENLLLNYGTGVVLDESHPWAKANELERQFEQLETYVSDGNYCVESALFWYDCFVEFVQGIRDLRLEAV